MTWFLWMENNTMVSWWKWLYWLGKHFCVMKANIWPHFHTGLECHVPTFPFSFYVGKTMPPTLACYGVFLMYDVDSRAVWRLGFGTVIKRCLFSSGFCLAGDWPFNRILLISIFSPVFTRKSSFPPSSWTTLSWIKQTHTRKQSKWLWECQYRGNRDPSQLLFLLVCFPSPINHNNPWTMTGWCSHTVLEERRDSIWYIVPKAGEEAAKGGGSIDTVWDAVLQQEPWQLLIGGWSYDSHHHCLIKSVLLP